MSLPDTQCIENFMAGYSGGGNEYPRVLSVSGLTDGTKIELEVSAGLDGFRGHFPGNPILPGIVQLHWAATFAAQLFGVAGQPTEIKQLKFKKVVQPPATLCLVLKQVSEKRINFEFASNDHSHSSGHMFFEQTAV